MKIRTLPALLLAIGLPWVSNVYTSANESIAKSNPVEVCRFMNYGEFMRILNEAHASKRIEFACLAHPSFEFDCQSMHKAILSLRLVGNKPDRYVLIPEDAVGVILGKFELANIPVVAVN